MNNPNCTENTLHVYRTMDLFCQHILFFINPLNSLTVHLCLYFSGIAGCDALTHAHTHTHTHTHTVIQRINTNTHTHTSYS